MAGQAVRHETVNNHKTLGAWLSSAWLAYAPRTKTFLEKLLKSYKAGPF
jgi:hypothetical protein